MSTLTSDPHISIDSSIGADLIATFFALIVYGVNLHQLYRYCRLFSDALFIRGLVFVVFLLETAHVSMTMHYTYFFLVTNFVNPAVIQNGTWSVSRWLINAQLSTVFAAGSYNLVCSGNFLKLVQALIVIFAQLFFVRRIYMIGYYYRIIASISALLLIAEIPLSIYVVVHLFGGDLKQGVMKTKWFTGVLCLLPTLVDTLLTYTLITVLRRSRAGLKRNDSIPDLIAIYVVNTGLLHWTLNLCSLIVFLTTKDKFVDQSYGAITIVNSRLYVATFLCVLNSREIHPSVAVFEGGNYGLNLIERANRRAVAETWNVPAIVEVEPAAINVKVATEIEDGRGWKSTNLDSVKTSGSEISTL